MLIIRNGLISFLRETFNICTCLYWHPHYAQSLALLNACIFHNSVSILRAYDYHLNATALQKFPIFFGMILLSSRRYEDESYCKERVLYDSGTCIALYWITLLTTFVHTHTTSLPIDTQWIRLESSLHYLWGCEPQLWESSNYIVTPVAMVSLCDHGESRVPSSNNHFCTALKTIPWPLLSFICIQASL